MKLASSKLLSLLFVSVFLANLVVNAEQEKGIQVNEQKEGVINAEEKKNVQPHKNCGDSGCCFRIIVCFKCCSPEEAMSSMKERVHSLAGRRGGFSAPTGTKKLNGPRV